MQTWIEGFNDQKVQTILDQLFDAYVVPTIDMIRREKWKHITPVRDFAMVQVICRILEGLLTPENCPPGSEKEVYEAYFQFACVWGLGGAFSSDKGADFRKQFDAYWRNDYAKVSPSPSPRPKANPDPNPNLTLTLTRPPSSSRRTAASSTTSSTRAPRRASPSGARTGARSSRRTSTTAPRSTRPFSCRRWTRRVSATSRT